MIEGSTKDMLHVLTANKKKGMITVPHTGSSNGLQATLGGQAVTWPLIILRRNKIFTVIDVTVDSVTLHGSTGAPVPQAAHHKGLLYFKDAITRAEDYAVLERNLYDYTKYCKQHALEMFHI